MDTPAEMERQTTAHEHYARQLYSFAQHPLLFQFHLFQANTRRGGKKSDSLSGNHHLLMIGLRPAETRLACDLHSASLNLWSIERKILLCAKKKKEKTLGHCIHLLFLVLFFAFPFQLTALK